MPRQEPTLASQKEPAIPLLRRFQRRKDRSPALAQFHDALTREILLTERMRIKAVIITASLLTAAFTLLHLIVPSVLDRIAHGRFELVSQFAAFIPFILFELIILYLLSRRLAMHRDVPT